MVIVMDIYDSGRGSILVGGVVVSITHGLYCDAGLQLYYQKYIVVFVYHLFYYPLHVPDIIITLGGFSSTVVLCLYC